MDLRQASYVVAIVDLGSFTAAAASIPVSQPALSQAVATLERELGAELFHRIGRRVRLTAAGEAFVGPARRMLRDAAVARAVVADVAGLTAGELEIVALPTLVVEPLVDLV
ncbi:MAG: LysR family transcriptional regulator, partial [Aquihabitans sp.]